MCGYIWIFIRYQCGLSSVWVFRILKKKPFPIFRQGPTIWWMNIMLSRGLNNSYTPSEKGKQKRTMAMGGGEARLVAEGGGIRWWWGSQLSETNPTLYKLIEPIFATTIGGVHACTVYTLLFHSQCVHHKFYTFLRSIFKLFLQCYIFDIVIC